MSNINSYKDLVVWQKSITLVKEIYLLTDKFPKSERFEITSQIRRSAVSIPSNIAEGFGRRSIKSSLQFYSIAFGSALELETQLIISEQLSLVDKKELEKTQELLTEVCKMLNRLTGNFKEIIASI